MNDDPERHYYADIGCPTCGAALCEHELAEADGCHCITCNDSRERATERRAAYERGWRERGEADANLCEGETRNNGDDGMTASREDYAAGWTAACTALAESIRALGGPPPEEADAP